MNPIVPVILCGGSGTRLWPLSRDSYPKQYLSLLTDDKKSLLQKTQERIKNFLVYFFCIKILLLLGQHISLYSP